MISRLVKMIFGFFRIFIESMNLGKMLDKDIRGIGFGACVNVEKDRGVGRGKCGYHGAAKEKFLKIYHQTLGKKKAEKHVEKMLRITQ